MGLFTAASVDFVGVEIAARISAILQWKIRWDTKEYKEEESTKSRQEEKTWLGASWPKTVVESRLSSLPFVRFGFLVCGFGFAVSERMPTHFLYQYLHSSFLESL